MKQAAFAFTKEEEEEAYSKMQISVMNLHPGYLDTQPKNTTEGNTCIQLWSPIINCIYGHSSLKIMWGDSVNQQSSLIKKQQESKKSIGDKIDFRVCFEDRNKLIDLLNGEIAKDPSNTKYFEDHTKLARECKNVSELFYSSTTLKDKEKKALKVRGIQLCGIEEEITETRLVEDGLYFFCPWLFKTSNFCRPFIPTSNDYQTSFGG